MKISEIFPEIFLWFWFEPTVYQYSSVAVKGSDTELKETMRIELQGGQYSYSHDRGEGVREKKFAGVRLYDEGLFPVLVYVTKVFVFISKEVMMSGLS